MESDIAGDPSESSVAGDAPDAVHVVPRRRRSWRECGPLQVFVVGMSIAGKWPCWAAADSDWRAVPGPGLTLCVGIVLAASWSIVEFGRRRVP